MKYSVTALFLLAFLGLAGVEVSAQKKPLDHSVYDSWQSVKSSMMSADGQVLVYAVGPQQGDGSVFVENLRTGATIEVGRALKYSFP